MKTFLTTLLLFISASVFAIEPVGNVYWVQFNSKTNTPYSIGNPGLYLSPRAIERRTNHHIAIDSTDLPVNPAYVASLKSLGLYVKHTSRWMNGAIVIPLGSTNIDSLVFPSFVKSVELRKGFQLKSSKSKFSGEDSLTASYYGNSFAQISMMGGQILHKYSQGEGVQIAVIDAGFKNADQINAFDSLRSRGGVLGTHDFVLPGNNVYAEDQHGTMVLSTMASINAGTLVGTAPRSTYWLLRSEDNYSEFPVEEDYWIIAAEFADSVGCDMINTSLGYCTFDNPALNHTYNEFDGKTMRISKAANLAVDKGMVVVCSAGNSGGANDPWGHIVAPSEAEKVLSVAAVDASKVVTWFSSRGFSGANFIAKPDISAMGSDVTIASPDNYFTTGSGTSFSSPILAGMAACLVSLYPEKGAVEIMDMIRQLGDRYPEHSLEYGYGIPNFSKLFPDYVGNQTLRETEANIYPTVFQSQLFISSCKGYKRIEIYTLGGQKLFSASILDEKNFELSPPLLSNLTKGVYFAVLKGDQKLKSFKLIKN